MKKLAMHWQVIIALFLGVGLAALFKLFDDKELLYDALGFIKSDAKKDISGYGWLNLIMNFIQPFGDIFIRILKLVAVPLVLFSIIVGIANLGDIRKLGKIGGKTLLAYVLTTAAAVTLGLVLVNVFAPGKSVSEDTRIKYRLEYELHRNDTLAENLIWKNPEYAELNRKVLEQSSGKEVDKSTQDRISSAKSAMSGKPLDPIVELIPKNIIEALTDVKNMLQIIFFAVFFGICLILLPEEHKNPITKVTNSLNEVFIKMITLVMRAMPFFVFALMAGQLAKIMLQNSGQIMEFLTFLLNYSLVVLGGLLLLIFVFYPTLVTTFVKKMSYKRFLSGIREAQLTAFSTSSSVATLPVTMDCVENELGVSERTTSFVLPIGATVNMDGTSLYQGVAVVAMAQLHMVDLSFSEQVLIGLTAILASIGAAAIPSAGLILMVIVLSSVNLPDYWIAIVTPVDRILDMFRTVTNVTGDGAVSTIIANAEGELSDVSSS